MDEILAEDTASEDESTSKKIPLIPRNVQAIPNSIEESSLEGDAKSLEDRAGSLDFAEQIAASEKLEREAQLNHDDVSTVRDETFAADKHSDVDEDDQQARKDPDSPLSDTQVDHHDDADDEREEKDAEKDDDEGDEMDYNDESKGELQFVPASYDESQERKAAAKLVSESPVPAATGQDQVNPSPGSDINNLAHLQNYNSSNATTTPPPNSSNVTSSNITSSNITASNFASPIISSSAPACKVSGTPNHMKYFENSNKFIYEIDNSRILIGKLQEFREPSFSQDEEDAIPDTAYDAKEDKVDTLKDLSTIPYVEPTPTQPKDEAKPSGLLDMEEFSLTFDNTPPSSPKKPKPTKPSTNAPLLQPDDKPTRKRPQRRFVDSNDETADSGVPLTTPRGPFSTTPTPAAPTPVSVPTPAPPTTTTTSTTPSLPHTSQQTEGSQFSQMSQQPFVFTKPVTAEQETRETENGNENEPSPKRRRVKRDSTSGKMLEPSSSSEEEKVVHLDVVSGSESEDDVFQQALARSKGKQFSSTPLKSTVVSDESGSSGKRNSNSITPPKQTKGGSKSITRIKTSPQDTQVMSQRSIRLDLKVPLTQHDSKQFKKKTADDTNCVTPTKQKASSSPWTKAKHKHDSDDDEDDFQHAAGKHYSPFSPSPVQSSPCIAVPLTSHNSSIVPSNPKLQPKKLQFPLKRKAKDDSLTVYDLESPVSQIYTRSSNSFFAGVTFIFTGLKTTKGQDSLGVMVESHGGQLGDFNSAPSPTETLRVTPYVILPSRFLVADKERRTLKYLLAIATGTPCIQPNWIRHCAEQNCVLPYVPYLLPVGYSLSREEILYITVPKCNILSGYLAKVIGADDFVNHWETVLRATGAAIMKGFDSVKQCHVIISDPFPDQEYKKLASANKVPIVSVEWVIQCLINQETQAFDGHPRFHYRYLRDHYSATGAPTTSKNAT